MTAYIYDRIERVKDGKKLNITIQQVTPDLKDAVVDHMIKNFVPREPLCRRTKMLEDPESLESFRRIWHQVLDDGAAIVALLDADGENPKVVGANCTGIAKKDGPHLPEYPGKAFNCVLGLVTQITEEANLWERYGVDRYLSALGLSVDRDFHGIGLGAAIVNARKKVCEKFDLPMTVTVFTAPESQHIATKLGFETVIECPYKDYNLKTSNVFRDLEGKITIMVKQYRH